MADTDPMALDASDQPAVQEPREVLEDHYRRALRDARQPLDFPGMPVEMKGQPLLGKGTDSPLGDLHANYYAGAKAYQYAQDLQQRFPDMSAQALLQSSVDFKSYLRDHLRGAMLLDRADDPRLVPGTAGERAAGVTPFVKTAQSILGARADQETDEAFGQGAASADDYAQKAKQLKEAAHQAGKDWGQRFSDFAAQVPSEMAEWMALAGPAKYAARLAGFGEATSVAAKTGAAVVSGLARTALRPDKVVAETLAEIADRAGFDESGRWRVERGTPVGTALRRSVQGQAISNIAYEGLGVFEPKTGLAPGQVATSIGKALTASQVAQEASYWTDAAHQGGLISRMAQAKTPEEKQRAAQDFLSEAATFGGLELATHAAGSLGERLRARGQNDRPVQDALRQIQVGGSAPDEAPVEAKPELPAWNRTYLDRRAQGLTHEVAKQIADLHHDEGQQWVHTGTSFDDQGRFQGTDSKNYQITAKRYEDGGLRIGAKDAAGNEVSRVVMDRNPDGSFTSPGVITDEGARGGGLARAMYDYAAKNYGLVKPSTKGQTDQGKAFWRANAEQAGRPMAPEARQAPEKPPGGPEVTSTTKGAPEAPGWAYKGLPIPSVANLVAQGYSPEKAQEIVQQQLGQRKAPPAPRTRYVDDAGVTHEVDEGTGFQYHVASPEAEPAAKPSLKERLLARGRQDVTTPAPAAGAPRPVRPTPLAGPAPKSTFEEAGLLPHEEYAYSTYRKGGEDYPSFQRLAGDPELLARYNEQRRQQGLQPKDSITPRTVKDFIDRAHRKLGGEGSLFANMASEGKARLIEDGALTVDADLHADPEVHAARGNRIRDLEQQDRLLDQLLESWQKGEISDEQFRDEHSRIVQAIEGGPPGALGPTAGEAPVRSERGADVQSGAEAGAPTAPATATAGGQPQAAAARAGGGEAPGHELSPADQELPAGIRGARVAAPRPSTESPVDRVLGDVVRDQAAAAAQGTAGTTGLLGVRLAESLWDHLSGAIDRLNAEYRRLASEMFPRTHDADRETGEKLTQLAAVPVYAKAAAARLIDKVLGPHVTEAEARMLGTVFQEMRHRFAKAQLAQQERALWNTDRAKAVEAGQASRAIVSFVGQENSPLRDEATYQQVKNSARFRDFLERWKEHMTPLMEEHFKTAQGMGVDDPIHSITQIPDYPMNAKAIRSLDEETPGTVYIGGRGNLKNLKIRPSPFAERATLAADAYDTDARHLIENSLARGAAAARKADFYRTGEANGVVKWDRPGQSIEGWREVPFARPPAGTQEAKPGEVAYVRDSIYPEVRTALDVDRPASIPILTPILNGLKRAGLASTVEAAYHSKNLLTVLLKPGIRASDLLTSAYDVIRGSPEAMDRLVDLARVGAAKEPHGDQGILWGGRTDPTTWMGRFLGVIDHTMRLTADKAFDNLVNQGLTPDTEAGRRNFINQLGQYNRKGQSVVVRLLRDLGIGPFATAGTNYWVQGLRSLLLRPGVEATSRGAMVQMQAEMLAKTVAVLGTGAALNYFMWGRADGDDNTPLGAIKVGNRDKGKTAYFDLTNLIGLTRGARETGLLSLLEGKRAGAPEGAILDKAQEQALGALVHPALGPGAQFGWTAATGKNLYGMKTAPEAKPGESQAWQNLVTALKQVNPVYSTLTSAEQPRKPLTAEEKGMKFLGPYGLHYRSTPPGKPPHPVRTVPVGRFQAEPR